MPRPPKFFHEFIGQKRVICYITKLVAGSKKLGKPAPSLLLVAAPGQGKTTLAEALAREYGGEGEDGALQGFHHLLGGKEADVVEKLQELKYGDILFLDEAASLGRGAQEVLYLALDRRKTFELTEGRRVDRSALQSIAEFALILATYEPGLIPKALRDRLELVEFDPYTIPELTHIARTVAKGDGVEITSQAARYLAERSQRTPRQIQRAVDLVQTLYPGVDRFGQDHVREYLASCGIDDYGLRPKQREYLRKLAAYPDRTSSVERLACAIGIDTGYLRRDVEPYLITDGFVEVTTSRSRRITERGLKVVRETREIDGDGG